MAENVIQMALDRDSFASPRGGQSIETPIFMDRAGMFLAGPAVLNTYAAKTGIVIGWRRGLISDDHYTPSGYRTMGDSHLVVVGTEADLGPKCRWSNVKSTLEVTLEVQRHTPDWRFSVGLQGVQALPPSGGTYRPYPSPWFLMLGWDGFVVFGIRLTDGVVRLFRTPLDPASDTFFGIVTLDMATGVVTLQSSPNSKPAMTPFYNANWGFPETPWPANAKLADNVEYPLCLGRIPPTPNANGYFGAEAARPDCTIRRFRILSDNANLLGQLHPTGPRPVSYAGAPSLPIVPFQGSGICLAVHKDQGVPDSVGDITVRDLNLHGGGSFHPGITLGAFQGRVLLENLSLAGLTRGVQSSQLAVQYPLKIRGLTTKYMQDTSVFLVRGYRTSIEEASLYGSRVALDLRGCTGSVRDVFVVPEDSRTGYDVLQHGGDVTWERVMGDYEWPTTIRCIGVQPHGHESAKDDTRTRIIDCSNGRDGGVLSSVYGVVPARYGNTGKLYVNDQEVTLP